MRALFLIALLVAGSAPSAAAETTKKSPARGADDAPFLTGLADAPAFEKAQTARLGAAREALDRLLAVKGARTVENTLTLYDEIVRNIDTAGNQAYLMSQVHPDAAMRSAGDTLVQQISAFETELSLNRGVYDALAAIDVKGADADTRFYLERTLRDFRLSGVDKDEATRAKVRKLQDELVLIGQEFDRNIREDVRKVTVDDAKELEGLPADYVARHKPDASGKIVLTTDYPDSIPVFSYAKSEGLRKKMYFEYNNRAYPKNEEVLRKLVAKRHELATTLGFKNWADYVTADKMVGSSKNASDFIDKVAAASADKAAREYQEQLARKRQDVPGAEAINRWENGYYAELVRKSNYNFDSQSVRPYFPFDRVQQGVLDTASKLFGVQFRKVDVPVWHPSVDAFEMLEGGKVVGRFYLDLHPRENKYKHAAHYLVRLGVKDELIPESALICNFPGGDPNDPGLMEHGDVTTFFHEFGHLLHSLFAGRHRWAALGGVRTERDFVEAPSQMLEEWAWDVATLQTFARHYKTNEPIPAALVAQMRRADEFGKALGVRGQMSLAKMSLSIYDRDPSQVNFEALNREITTKYTPYPFAPESHYYTAFGHLNGYSAAYYTYMWSLVIAKDMFSQFDRKNLLDPAVARRYRETVLARGGFAPAGTLVGDFLGRPFNFDAWQRWLNEDTK